MSISGQISYNQNNSSNVINYLIKKLEARSRNMQKSRNALNNIFNMQDLIENKKEMIRHFYEIEDDITQGSMGLKAVISQNGDLQEQLDIANKNYKSIEQKYFSHQKIMDQLTHKSNEIFQENIYLKENLVELDSNNTFFKDRISFLENSLKIKSNEIEEMNLINKHNLEKIENLNEENTLLKLQIENLKKMKVESRPAIENKDLEYHNIKNIINEREQSKKFINEKIKDFDINPDSDVNEYKNLNEKKKENYTAETQKSRNRADQLSNLVVRVLASPENINIFNKRLGSDFMKKMVSQNINESFITKVEDILEELENNQKSSPSFKNEKNTNMNYNNINNSTLNVPNFAKTQDQSKKNLALNNLAYQFEEFSNRDTQSKADSEKVIIKTKN